MKILTDDQIIAKHSPNVRDRARLELQLVNCIIETARDQGFTLRVTDYEHEGITEYDVKTALFDLDEATVKVERPDGSSSFIYLVFGNSGYDLISNYSSSAKDFLQPAFDLSRKLGA